MGTVSAVLIVTNEEKRIENCLESIAWADEIVVVDGGSTDRTREIAKKYTSKIYERPLDNFANQKNFGIDRASGEWILSVDADEVVTPELRESLRRAAENPEINGFYVERKNFIFGKELRFGGQGKEKLLRFFRKDRGGFEQPIHEKVAVHGKVGELKGDLLHYSSSSVEEYFRKLRLYTDLEAAWMKEKGIRPGALDLWLKPALRFFYFYLVRLGFLDGYEGFLYHCLSSFYYLFKYVRLKESQNGGIAQRAESNLPEAAV